MTLSYVARLVWMALASFFLVNLTTGLLVSLLTPAALRIAARMRAPAAARFLLAVRLFPSVFAVFTVVALCIPSYLWLEPEALSEEIGPLCLLAAAACVAVWTMSIARSARAVIRSSRYIRDCRRCASELRLPGHGAAGWVIDGNGHVLGLSGVFQPEFVIDKDVCNALSPEQLDVALRHEWAHAASRDNLKKLLILLAPDALPFVRARFRELDHAWSRVAEWAADDRAAAGDARRSLCLAEALVSVARLGVQQRTAPLITSLVGDAGGLEARVNRLLEPSLETRKSRSAMRRVAVCVVLSLLSVTIVFGPSALYAVHELLESLAR